MTNIWFLEDRARLSRELAAIEELTASRNWLTGTCWTVDAGLFCLDAVIRAHDHDYHVRMEYPKHFPSAPPTVRPTNAEFRWTTHQYGGIDGPLCLEWGPDNWLPDMTGAQMLESAHNLFSIENPLGKGKAERIAPAPSRHSLTLGQELRSAWCRFYIAQPLLDLLASLPERSSGVIKFSNHSRTETWVSLVHVLEPLGAAAPHVDTTIPKFMCGPDGDKSLSIGAFYKTNLEPAALSDIKLIFELKSVLWQSGHDVSIFAEEMGINPLGLTVRPFGVLVLDQLNAPHFFLTSDNKAIKAAPVHTHSPAEPRRQSDNLEGLSSKSVGVVGLGSAGSKIALVLARMGVKTFYLVDYDVFLPENVRRHALDWDSVGEHKVDGMRELLARVSADTAVDVSKIHLTGQESTAVVSGNLQRLSQCDIILDATANPDVFNLLAAVTTSAQKPLVWFEVFGGGHGGFVARSRPDRDPSPHVMRDAYNRFCIENPAPEDAIIANYTTEDAAGRVMEGSDADVSIIAHNAARLAVDTVLGFDPSTYPYSMYLIGLDQWWVFSQPFHNIPIATDHLHQHQDKPTLAQAEDAKVMQFIIDLLNKNADANSSPPEIIERLVDALERAGAREIGGILMGEHIAEDVFRVKDLTIQDHGGNFAAFVRVVQDVIAPLLHFFRATSHNYTRFNYLGEWHSHPSFVPEPSSKDCETMRDIIEDLAVGANFVVLMIVKLNQSHQFEGTVTIFHPDRPEYLGDLVLENEYDDD